MGFLSGGEEWWVSLVEQMYVGTWRLTYLRGYKSLGARVLGYHRGRKGAFCNNPTSDPSKLPGSPRQALVRIQNFARGARFFFANPGVLFGFQISKVYKIQKDPPARR